MGHGRRSAIVTDRLDMTFLAARTAPGQVRTLVDLRLASWGLAGLRDDVALIASELVTNAILHTPEQQIRVQFTREPCGVLLMVWDSSDALPVRKPPMHTAPMRADGRGLPIVEALSSKCGISPTRPCGKWIWARVLA
ncbi:ATP-binding protein [Actinomadura formosensis]|uniref:ATP-binding protein n=1 Tax=Actinomadura formosensis TaxID=60706 RepID=UPI000A763C42|nr:ATP-binding protein [Actinomadura formosensis]